MKWHLNSCEQRSFKITVKPVITGIHVTEILYVCDSIFLY